MNIQWASIAVTIGLAVFALLGTYFYNLHLARRKDRLELVNRQINDFYGPLYVSCRAGTMATAAFRRRLGQDKVFADRSKPTDRELEVWKIWLPSVLMPANEFRESLILKNCHLIRETEVPECLLTFLAHTAAYKAVLKRWELADYSEVLSVVDFPKAVEAYAAATYRELKLEQAKLLGRKIEVDAGLGNQPAFAVKVRTSV